MKRWLLTCVLMAVALLMSPGVARADAVDEAFARGNEAAQARRWDDAVQAYEQAAALLPERSALLSYNLGTAYAQLGELGRATYHLERALDFRGGPTAEIVEATRDNLDAVRRRVEFEATASSSMVDRPETSWDLVVEALEAPGLGWLALISGWLFLVTLWIHQRRRWTGRKIALTRAALIGLAALYVAAGLLHGWAVRADRTAPEAIVLDARVDAREGPGTHTKIEFTLQGGAHVRIVDRTPGWRRVRLPGGVEGWVSETSVARLDASKHPAPRRSAS